LKYDEWINFFKKNKRKKLFSLSDLIVLTEENKSSLSVQLSRLVKSKIINRVARDWYENPFNSASTEEISMTLRYPCYLSMEYALYKNNILSQQVFTLTLVTTKQPYTYIKENATYEFHQIKKSLFWGYERIDMINIAESEKALLDLIYIRSSKGSEMTIDSLYSLVDDMDFDELNKKILLNYALKFDTGTQKILADILKEK